MRAAFTLLVDCGECDGPGCDCAVCEGEGAIELCRICEQPRCDCDPLGDTEGLSLN